MIHEAVGPGRPESERWPRPTTMGGPGRGVAAAVPAGRMLRCPAFASLHSGPAMPRDPPDVDPQGVTGGAGQIGGVASSGGRVASIWARLRSISSTTSRTASAERRRAR